MGGVKPEICNGAALRQAARHVTRLYDDALAPIGIGLNQFSALARMSRVGPSPVQELARHLVMDRSTLGHLLRPLEVRGLVRLRVSKEDRRGRVVMLTAAGRLSWQERFRSGLEPRRASKARSARNPH